MASEPKGRRDAFVTDSLQVGHQRRGSVDAGLRSLQPFHDDFVTHDD